MNHLTFPESIKKSSLAVHNIFQLSFLNLSLVCSVLWLFICSVVREKKLVFIKSNAVVQQC